MTQNAIQLPTAPPLSGADLVTDTNSALLTVATDFAGAADPATLAGPYMTWADTGNMLLKRRNTANTAWVVEGTLFKASLPQYALADVPTADKGPIYVIGVGNMEWKDSAYALVPVAASAVSVVAITNLAATDVQAALAEIVGKQAGIGQTLQDVTSSRSVGVAYTNSTGKPIVIYVGGNTTSGNGFMYGQINGSIVALSENATAAAGVGVSFIVPDGATYTISTASVTVGLWREYR